MMNTWKKCAALTGLMALMATAALAPPKEAADVDAAKAKDKALEKVSQHENAAMGQFVLEQIEAGKSGEDLAAAIKEKKAAIAASKDKAKDAGKSPEAASAAKAEAKAKSESLTDAIASGVKPEDAANQEKEAKAKAKEKRAEIAKKHGLADDDINGMGAFVNEKHDEGLRGEELSAAIKDELNRRKAIHQDSKEAKKARAKDKSSDDGPGDDKGQSKDKVKSDDNGNSSSRMDKIKSKADDNNKNKGNSGAAGKGKNK